MSRRPIAPTQALRPTRLHRAQRAGAPASVRVLRPIVFALAGLVCAIDAHADFSGAFAPSQWSVANSNGGNGTTVSSDTARVLTSSDFTGTDADLTPSLLRVTTTVAAATVIGFDWRYTTADDNGSSMDSFVVLLGDSLRPVSADASFATQSGHVVLRVGAGQTVGFGMASVDSFGGSATVTITDFTAVAAPVPEPETSALLLAGLTLLGGVVRRRRSRPAQR